MVNYDINGYGFLTKCYEEYQTEKYKKQTEENEKQDEETEKDEKQLKKRNESIFNRWVQLNLEVIPVLIRLSIKCPSAIAIFFFILDEMNNYNALICSKKLMGEIIGISLASVTNGISALKEHNIVYVYKSGTTNVYTLNPITSWKSRSENVKYCEFPNSKVIIGWNENSRKYNKKPIIVKQDKT